jgi:hypothetical protein
MSGNGTFVNGRRLTQEVPLDDSDEIRVGHTVLIFHGSSGLHTVIDRVPSTTGPSPPGQPPGPMPVPTPGPTSGPSGQRASGRVNLVGVLVMAGVLQVIGLAGNAAITFVGDRGTGVVRWIAVPVLTVLLAMVTALVQALGQRGSAPAGTSAETPRRQSRGRTPVAVAVLVVLILVGGAGIGIAAGAQYAVAWATGKEKGPDRLAAPVSKGGSIAVTVQHVFHTRHFTRVELVARNNTDTSLTLPLFKNCTLTARDGTTLEADSFRSQWSETLPPGVTQRGTITFDGHLAPTRTTATLSFAIVFGRPGGGALTIPGLRIRAR